MYHLLLMMKGSILLLIGAVSLSLCACDGPQPPEGVKPIEKTVTVTGYCACGKCCSWQRNWLFKPVYATGPSKGKKKDIGVTASGTRARYGTIAADTSKYPFGTVMYVEGYGFGRVEDRGGRIKGDHIDLYFHTHKQALDWGNQKLKVRVYFVPKAEKDKPKN